jgi:hypothetical protein
MKINVKKRQEIYIGMRGIEIFCIRSVNSGKPYKLKSELHAKMVPASDVHAFLLSNASRIALYCGG